MKYIIAIILTGFLLASTSYVINVNKVANELLQKETGSQKDGVGGSSPSSSGVNISQTGENLVIVADQKPGESVLANYVLLENRGYVVIREENNGKIGEIVGVSFLLPKGESQNIDIKVPKGTKDEKIFYVMLHTDNGDGGFDTSQDLPLKEENGKIFHMKFQVKNNTRSF